MGITRAQYEWFNLAEGGLWFAMALVCVVAAYRRPAYRGVASFAAGAFAVFGVTDWIEMRVYPPWLFPLKAACVVALFGAYVRYAMLRRCLARRDAD